MFSTGVKPLIIDADKNESLGGAAPVSEEQAGQHVPTESTDHEAVVSARNVESPVAAQVMSELPPLVTTDCLFGPSEATEVVEVDGVEEFSTPGALAFHAANAVHGNSFKLDILDTSSSWNSIVKTTVLLTGLSIPSDPQGTRALSLCGTVYFRSVHSPATLHVRSVRLSAAPTL